MDDLISRQEAIEAVETKIKKWNAVDGEGYHVGLGLRYTDVIDTLTELPSTQPEVIRCKDCEYFRKDYGWNCIEYTVCAISPIHKVIRKPDDYCSRAERRTDG